MLGLCGSGGGGRGWGWDKLGWAPLGRESRAPTCQMTASPVFWLYEAEDVRA